MGQERTGKVISGYSTATPNTTHTFPHFSKSAWDPGAQARLAIPSEGRGSEQICEASTLASHGETATPWAPGQPPRVSGQLRACRGSAGITRPARLSVPVPPRRSARPAVTQQLESEIGGLSPTVQLGTPRQATSTRAAGRTRDKLSTHRTVEAMFTRR